MSDRYPDALDSAVSDRYPDALDLPGQRTYDVVGIGNAIVDHIAHVPLAEVTRLGLARGAMTLVDAGTASAIGAAMDAGGLRSQVSGGSVANTMVGLAMLGRRGAFVGRVARDALGKVFVDDLQRAGVDFAGRVAADGGGAGVAADGGGAGVAADGGGAGVAGAASGTGRCHVLVTEDAERTMATYLGAAAELSVDEVEEAPIGETRVVYFESYLWDPPEARAGLRRAVERAGEAGAVVALSLSDPFVVERHRDELLELLGHGAVRAVFANADEARLLFETDDVDKAVEALAERVVVAAVTLGAQGSVAVSGDDRVRVPAHPAGAVVDTTGAGDLYAAGFLSGLLSGAGLRHCGELGGLAAAEVISHLGARPVADLAELVTSAGLQR